MDLSELKEHHNLMKISEEVITKKVMKDIFLKLIFNIQKSYIVFIMAYFFYPKKMKIGKAERLYSNLHGKNEYLMHIRNLKQALNHGLVLKTFHRAIKLNEKAWLKSYIGMNIDLRKAIKNNFEINFFKLINSWDFGKTMENKYRKTQRY